MIPQLILISIVVEERPGICDGVLAVRYMPFSYTVIIFLNSQFHENKNINSENHFINHAPIHTITIKAAK